jgi:hypothetical protein
VGDDADVVAGDREADLAVLMCCADPDVSELAGVADGDRPL